MHTKRRTRGSKNSVVRMGDTLSQNAPVSGRKHNRRGCKRAAERAA